MIKLVNLLLEYINEGRIKGATSLAIEKLFTSNEIKSTEFAGKLVRRKSSNRITNLGDVSSDAFKDLLEKVFSTSVTVTGPGSGSDSSKFNTFEFKIGDHLVALILAGKGAVESQRQERGLIDAITYSGVTNIKFKNRLLTGVTGAEKAPRSATYRHEPYADIELTINGKAVLVSAKGFKAPSFGGGGLSGIDAINIKEMNAFVETTYTKVYNQYLATINSNPGLKNINLQGNPNFKDYYEAIPLGVLEELLTGKEAIGGPVNYYYMGDMDVLSRVEGNTLVVDGSLLTVSEFIETIGTFYLRIAKRNGPCYFTTETSNLTNFMVPKLFTIKPNGVGGTQSRAFITTTKEKPSI